ncbi:MAG: Ig-like domain-containing protein [Alistipes sp.]|nr:Ig-like domain-containing protein [Candidatus Alistipes equi]
MKRIIYYLLGSTLFFASCSKSDSEPMPDPEPEIQSVISTRSSLTLNIGDERQLDFKAIKNDGTQEDYDINKNILEIEFSSDDKKIVEIDSNGKVRALDSGVTNIRGVSKIQKEISLSVKITVNEEKFYDLSRKFSSNMKVGTFHAGGYDSQCFDIDSKGNIYYAFSKSLGHRGYLGIMRMAPSGETSQEMILYYAYHGTSFSIEEVGDDVYIWTSTFGTKSSDGTYGNSQMFCRIKFEPGKEYTPEDIAQNCFYRSDIANVNVSRNRKNGRIAVQFTQSATEGGKNYTHRVDIFSSEDLLSAPLKQVTTKSMTRGGDWKGPITSERSETSTVTARDISSVKPLASFRYVNSEVYGSGPDSSGKTGVKSFQGFCFYDKYIYIANDRNRYTRDATLTKLSLEGKLMHGPTHMTCVDDIDAIRACGLVGTDTYLEIEGIQIVNNSLHFGCLSWDATGCFNSVINTYPR